MTRTNWNHEETFTREVLLPDQTWTCPANSFKLRQYRKKEKLTQQQKENFAETWTANVSYFNPIEHEKHHVRTSGKIRKINGKLAKSDPPNSFAKINLSDDVILKIRLGRRWQNVLLATALIGRLPFRSRRLKRIPTKLGRRNHMKAMLALYWTHLMLRVMIASLTT